MAPTANHPWCVTHQTNHRLGYSCSPISRSSKEVRDIPEPQQNRSSKAHVVHPSPKEAPDLKEQLAAIEHERWADWQKWVHKHLTPDTEKVYGRYYISGEMVRRWERQIRLPYDKLTEAEKASDMEQVDRYWSLISQHIAEQVEAAWQRGYNVGYSDKDGDDLIDIGLFDKEQI